MIAWLTELKDGVDIAQGVATILAIGAAAYWFWQRRQKFPRAKTVHEIHSWRMPDGRWLLRTTLIVDNIGEVLLALDCGFTRVQQMRPWPDDIDAPTEKAVDRETEVQWPLLAEMKVEFPKGEREIEPHENDTIPFEFVLPEDAELVVVYTYIRNSVKRLTAEPFSGKAKEIGWSATTIHQLGGSTAVNEVGDAPPLKTPQES